MEWLASITTTGLFAFALWLGRNLITTRLTQSVKHEFDSKLELFRSDLRTQDTEIAILRSGALTAMSSRQIAFDKRRLEAIDKLWSQFLALKPARHIFTILLGLDSDAVLNKFLLI